MSQAISFWGLEVPAGEGPTPMISDIPRHSTTVRITMAAIDPTAEPLNKDEPLRATLKIMRRAPGADDYDDEEDEDEDDEEEEGSDEEESEKEEEKPKKGKLSKKEADAAVKKALEIAEKNAEKMEVDGQEEEDSDDEDDTEGFEIETFTLCTLDADKNYQQPLDLTIDEDDEVFFKVIGNFDVSLSGNYIVPAHSHDDEHGDDYDSEEDSDYDLSPDEDELYGDSDSDEDELDDVENPRITEIDSEEEAETPKKENKAEKKGTKRPAEESKEESKPEEKKLSKKQLKKLKANNGAAVDTTTETPDKKSVKFAEKLEQGPTPSSAEKKKAPEPKKEAAKPAENKPKTQVVQGVVIEDKKIGTGAVAKNGARLGMRYIGKLQNGKTFDSNTKGKPFTFRLGRGEVIKGWDVGLAGMRIGGERRLTIPANMAYGKQSMPGIPGNSTLIFDVKLLEVK